MCNITSSLHSRYGSQDNNTQVTDDGVAMTQLTVNTILIDYQLKHDPIVVVVTHTICLM